MSYYSNNQNQNNDNNGIGAVIGTIGSIVGFIALLSFLGNIGSAASTAASVRAVSNKASVQDTEPDRTANTNNSWEEQRQKFLDQIKKDKPTLTLAEPIRYRPNIIEMKKLDLTKFEIKQTEQFFTSELFVEKAILNIPRFEEPQIVFDDDFINMKSGRLIETDLSSSRLINKGIINNIPQKYKTLNDMGLDKYLGAYSEYLNTSSRMNFASRHLAKSKMRKQYSYDDNNLITNTAQDISDSMQVTETDFSSVNVVEENIMNEFNDMGYGHDIVSTKLDKYDVTPLFQIQDIPNNVNTAIPDKILAW